MCPGSRVVESITHKPEIEGFNPGGCYKTASVISYAPRVMLQIAASLTDNSRGIIYDVSSRGNSLEVWVNERRYSPLISATF